MIWLFIYALAVSLYDLHARRIPNWCTLPLLAAAVFVNFPGRPEVWFASFALAYAWAGDWMSAGDVKLWMAVLWALPDEYSTYAFLFVFISFFITGLAQILWRIIRKQPATHLRAPAAWRTLPFLLLCWWYVY